MKKVLFGILILGALSACSSSEEKVDIPTQINELNQTVDMNAETLEEVKSENEELKTQIEAAKKEATEIEEYNKIAGKFDGTGTKITKTEDGSLSLIPSAEASFKLNKAELNENIKKTLDSIVETLEEYPEAKATIKGHTDATGPEEFNKKLSEERAKSVSDYLISKGIDSSRIETVGIGTSEPIADDSTKEGKMQNRNVDITISF